MPIKFSLSILIILGTLLPACSVNVKKDENGKENNVDIQTPVASIHVGDDVDPRDTGLAVYPGARRKKKEGDDNAGANVNISSGLFGGVKVVAVEFQTEDAPEKVIAFYKDQLKRYGGNVLQCHTREMGTNVDIGGHEHGTAEGSPTQPLKCPDGNDGKTVELKVGTEGNQHLVAIEPEGKGTSFGMVYIRARGHEGTI